MSKKFRLVRKSLYWEDWGDGCFEDFFFSSKRKMLNWFKKQLLESINDKGTVNCLAEALDEFREVEVWENETFYHWQEFDVK